MEKLPKFISILLEPQFESKDVNLWKSKVSGLNCTFIKKAKEPTMKYIAERKIQEKVFFW